MAVQEVIPNKNVKVVDIRDTLNYHGSVCTNDVKSLFDDRAVINHWSIRKPYNIYDNEDDLFILTDEKIYQNNCGLDMTNAQVGSYLTLPDKMDGDMNNWVYNRPTGGPTQPFRLGDYVGYYASAPPMIQNFYVPSIISLQESTKIEASAIVTAQNGKSVTLSDLPALSDMEAAVYMKKNNDDLWTNIRNEGVKLINGSFNVSIDISDFLTTGTWVLYPYMTNGKVHFMIPNVSPKTVTVVDTFYRISMTGEKATTGEQTVYWSVRVTNRSGENKTFNNNYIYLRKSGKELNDPSYENGEKRVALSDGLIALADSTTTIASGSFTYVHDDVWTSPRIGVTLNSGNYTAYQDVVSTTG